MTTTEILNTSEYSEFYNYCEYELTEKDFNFIKQAIQAPKEVFCTNAMFNGSIILQYRDEDSSKIEKKCRIFYTTMIVYRDSVVYLKIVEKHSEEAYEIFVDEDYIKENIKDIPVVNKIEEIQAILDLDVITDKEKLEEIELICARH
jgi:hypothetical protein